MLVDSLSRLAVDFEERRAQQRMPVDQLLHGMAQAQHIQRPAESDGVPNIVGRARTIELVKDPQCTLRVRQRHISHKRRG